MNSSPFLRLVAVLVSVFALTGCSTKAKMAKIRNEYAGVATALKGQSDGFFIVDSPEASASLDRKWSLQALWVTTYLEEHPFASAKEVESAVSALDGNLGCEVTLLGPGLYGVATQEGEIGNAFVVVQNGRHYRMIWNAKDLRVGSTADSKLLSAWSAEAARSDCRSKVKDEDWLSCGPVYGRFGFVPSDDKGQQRFYLEGSYAELAGMSVGAQLSVWVWDGSNLKSQYVGVYSYYIDQPAGVRLEGDILRVRVREQYRMFSTCCDDEGRPMDWNLKLTSTGIQDLGYSPVSSALETMDELFYRTENGLNTDDMATPEVRKKTRALLRRSPKASGLPSLGTLMPPYPNPSGDAAGFCAEFEEYGLRFSTKIVRDKRYLTGMRQLANCPDTSTGPPAPQ